MNGQSARAGDGAPVVLIGAPGAGKTTVGAALAARLGVTFTDTDVIVEAMAGKPVSDIFITDGEPEFRRLERAAVAEALAATGGARRRQLSAISGPTRLPPGGGAPLIPTRGLI